MADQAKKKSKRAGTKQSGSAGGRKKTAKAAANPVADDDNVSPRIDEAPDGGEILGDRFWRFIAMVAFALLAYFALFPFLVLAAMQFGVVLMTGEKNEEVHQLLGRLANYVKECLDFIAYRTNVMPFPFGPVPPAE